MTQRNGQGDADMFNEYILRFSFDKQLAQPAQPAKRVVTKRCDVVPVQQPASKE